MVDVKLKYRSGSVADGKVPFTIGDIVFVKDPGYQYSALRDLFWRFWNDYNSYHIPYEWDSDNICAVPLPKEHRKQWKIVNAIFYVGRPLQFRYHIRDKYGHNVVVSDKALELVRRPRPASIGIATIQQYD
jgi:hypothetical protein